MAGADEFEDERRRAERIPINDEFSSLDAAAGSTWVSDLSHSGVFVHTDALLPVGTLIDLRFTILVEDPILIEASAKVVRHSRKPRGMGVEFASLRPSMRAQIDEVLARRRPLDSGAPLRLPEPRREPTPPASPVSVPAPIEDDVTRRVAFARPAPVSGLALRPTGAARDADGWDDAATASYPRVDDDGPTTVFVEVADPDEDDRTREYEALSSED